MLVLCEASPPVGGFSGLHLLSTCKADWSAQFICCNTTYHCTTTHYTITYAAQSKARRNAKKEVEELQRMVAAQKSAVAAADAAADAAAAVEAEADQMKRDDAQRLADATAATAEVLRLAASDNSLHPL